MSPSQTDAAIEVNVRDPQGLHARPVMRFVDAANKFQSSVSVSNVSRRGEKVDGKSAMQMMLLEATSGCVLRIEARGPDAREAVAALGALIEGGLQPQGADREAPESPQ